MSVKLFPAGSLKDHRKEFDEYFHTYFPSGRLSDKVSIFIDVIWCYFRYGSWTNNYFEYRFWEKSSRERDTFLTWKKARKFINQVNGEKHDPTFRKKHQFLAAFGEDIHRNWIFVKEVSYETFVSFLEKNPVFMEKNDEGMFGIGVSRKKTSEITDYKDYYEYGQKNNILLEECIDECQELKKCHAESLNTLRVVTLVDSSGEEAEILAAVYRMGNNGSHVDNARSEGLFAEIDLETGIIKTEGMNFMGAHYIRHPYSNEKIIGLEIPIWEEVKRTCKKAAAKFPNVRLVGWDVVVRQKADGLLYVELIEGNDRPGVPTLQVPGQKGIYKKVKNYENKRRVQ